MDESAEAGQEGSWTIRRRDSNTQFGRILPTSSARWCIHRWYFDLTSALVLKPLHIGREGS